MHTKEKKQLISTNKLNVKLLNLHVTEKLKKLRKIVWEQFIVWSLDYESAGGLKKIDRIIYPKAFRR